MTRICLVALNALPAVDPDVAGPIGGIETRAWAFSRGLARRTDFDVQLLVRHTRPLRRTAYDGVTLIPWVDRFYRIREAAATQVRRRAGFPWIAFRGWSWPLLWQLPLVALNRPFDGHAADPRAPNRRLTQIDADVFATFGVQSHSASVIASAQATGRPALLFIGSDGDLDERYVAGSTYVSPYGDRGDVCRFIIDRADAIVAQTEWQVRTLRERFGRQAHLIENPIDVDAWDAARGAPLPTDLTGSLTRYVLWVGRAESVHKRPEVCLELARLCPDVSFLIVLNPRDAVVDAHVRNTAPSNVRIVSRVPFSLMPALFARAAAFVNTSSLEGFPNVFLQAALSRCPVGSLEVGGEFLERSSAGMCAEGNLERLADFVRTAWSAEIASSTASDRARDYVIRRHGLPVQIDRLSDVLRSLLGRRVG